jgi:hypothetical protein
MIHTPFLIQILLEHAGLPYKTKSAIHPKEPPGVSHKKESAQTRIPLLHSDSVPSSDTALSSRFRSCVDGLLQMPAKQTNCSKKTIP